MVLSHLAHSRGFTANAEEEWLLKTRDGYFLMQVAFCGSLKHLGNSLQSNIFVTVNTQCCNTVLYVTLRFNVFYLPTLILYIRPAYAWFVCFCVNRNFPHSTQSLVFFCAYMWKHSLTEGNRPRPSFHSDGWWSTFLLQLLRSQHSVATLGLLYDILFYMLISL